MEIRLETEEVLDVTVDGTCDFQIYGYRNEEGTMKLGIKKRTGGTS